MSVTVIASAGGDTSASRMHVSAVMLNTDFLQ